MIQSQLGSMVGCHAYEGTVYAGRGQKDRKACEADECVACPDCRLWRIALGSTRDKLNAIC